MNSGFFYSAAQRLAPRLAIGGRYIFSYPRYWLQLSRACYGYLRYGHRYPNRVVFVAGLPKSGTSWLESMLASIPGYTAVMPPAAIRWELEHGGSHDLVLSREFFSALRGCLAIVKLHAGPSRINRQLLRRWSVPHIILFRDPRDVAVSHVQYVKTVPWHPEHRTYVELDTEQAFLHFADTLLDPYVSWIQDWLAHRDPRLSVVVRYEELHANARSALGRVLVHCGIECSPSVIGRIVDEHAFEVLTRGRQQGCGDSNSFLRKGVVGDWRAAFSSRVRSRFEEVAGERMTAVGYGLSRRSSGRG